MKVIQGSEDGTAEVTAKVADTRMSSIYAYSFRHRGLLIVPPILVSLIHFRGEVNSWVVWPIGLGLFLAGVLGRVWAQQHLRHRLKVAIVLTQTGPYAWVRNPLYISNVLICLGLNVISGVLWLLPITIAWCALVYSLVVREEERRFHQQYGETYDAYFRKVNRWRPRAPGNRMQFVNSFFAAALKAEAHNLLYIVPFIVKWFSPALLA